MADSRYSFLSAEERREREEQERREREEARAAARRKQEEDTRTITRIVRAAAYEVDVLAAELDPTIREILTEFVEASSGNTPLIEKTEFCPHDEIDEAKPWQRYEIVHRWHAEYTAAHIHAEIQSMTTDRPLPFIGAFSGIQLRVLIKWGHSIPIVNLQRLDDVFEARIGIPSILDVEYESEDPARQGATRFRYSGA